MLGLISVGQCGGSIIDIFAKNDYPTMAINSSQRDLDTCEHVQHKLKIIGTEGVGRNRELAINLMSKHWETSISSIKEHFSQPSIQLIFVVFSTGGGTGSGGAPILCELLQNELPDKVIVAVPVLPSIQESVVSQINTLDCLKELSELDIAILPIDNNQHSNLTKNELYKEINNTFFNLIHSTIEQTEQHSSNGNLDQKDLLTLLSTPAFCHLSHTTLTNLKQNISISEESITQSIKESWQQGIFTPPSLEKIVRFGFIYNGQEGLMQYLNIPNILSDYTNTPMDIFEGYYSNTKGDIFTIATGLKFNSDRLKEIEDKTTSESAVLQGVLSTNHNLSIKSTKLQIRPTEKKKKDLASILSKYQK